jgi:hypothetical protein
MQKLKGHLKNEVCWNLGKGTLVPVLHQPWYEGWQDQPTNQIEEARWMRVVELVNQETGKWKEHRLLQLFGLVEADKIQRTVPPPLSNALRNDKLIWKQSTKGVYSVKEGYKLLMSHKQEGNNDATTIWDKI